MIIICSKCRRVLNGSTNYLTVDTTTRIYQFCNKCVKSGFIELSTKKDKSPDMIDLLGQFRKYLKGKKLFN